ncbi:MAG: ABC transporter permease [bacterium]
MLKKILQHLNILIIITLVWYLVTESEVFSIILLPTPKSVFIALATLLPGNGLYLDIFTTLYRMTVGLIIGIITGIMLGLIMSSSKKIYNTAEFWLDFLRSIPAPALVPLFLLFFGIGDISKIALTIFVTALLVAINTVYGVLNSKESRIMAGKTIGLSKREILLKIILPDSLPYISSGIRVAISFAMVVVVVSEMIIGANYGLGRKIIDYQLMFQTANMYAVIILTGILGYTFNKLYLIFEKRYIHWMGK